MSLSKYEGAASAAESSPTLISSSNSQCDLEKYEVTFNDEGVCIDGDKLIVDWDGPEDLENPRNWSNARRWTLTAMISFVTFASGLPSAMIAPGAEQISEEFGLDNKVIRAMVTSIYVLAFGVGPLVFGPLSEIFGRRAVLAFGNSWFLIWNFICGFAHSTPQIIVFRFLAGLGGSVPLGIGNSILGDMWCEEDRGRALATYNLMPLLSPALGPLIGSWIAAKTTWRWVFWSLSIFQIIIMLGTLYFDETYPPVLLERKARGIKAKLAAAAGQDSNIIGFYRHEPIASVNTVYSNKGRTWRAVFAKALTRPFVLFFQEPIIQVMALYMSFVYGMLYFFSTTILSTFKHVYGQSLEVSGLNYIAMGLGIAIASQVNANTMNQSYVYLKNRYGGVRKPEFRLPPMVLGSLFLPLGLLITGWSTETHLHWIFSDIGLFFFGMGMITNFQCIQIYVIDAFTLYSASALAAVIFLRSVAGFTFPLFAPVMYDRLGYGKGNTILACIGLVIGCPAPILLWIYGERIRRASRHSKK